MYSLPSPPISLPPLFYNQLLAHSLPSSPLTNRSIFPLSCRYIVRAFLRQTGLSDSSVFQVPRTSKSDNLTTFGNNYDIYPVKDCTTRRRFLLKKLCSYRMAPRGLKECRIQNKAALFSIFLKHIWRIESDNRCFQWSFHKKWYRCLVVTSTIKEWSLERQIVCEGGVREEFGIEIMQIYTAVILFDRR